MKFILALLLFVMCLGHMGTTQASTLALGDSLAVGFGGASRATVVGEVGISSCVIASMVPHKHFDAVLLSAGTNDPPGPCIESIRIRIANWIHPAHVVWIVPVIDAARRHVVTVANSYHDGLRYYKPSKNAWPHPSHYYNITGRTDVNSKGHPAIHHERNHRRISRV